MIVDWIKGILIDNWQLIAGAFVAFLVVVRLIYAAVEHPIDNIKRFWREIVIIALICCAGLMWYSQSHTIAQQQAAIAAAAADNKLLTDNNKALLDAVSQVNTMVSQFDQYSADTKKRFDTINSDVKTSNSALVQQLSVIMKDKKPATCEEAMLYLIDANKGYAK